MTTTRWRTNADRDSCKCNYTTKDVSTTKMRRITSARGRVDSVCERPSRRPRRQREHIKRSCSACGRYRRTCRCWRDENSRAGTHRLLPRTTSTQAEVESKDGQIELEKLISMTVELDDPGADETPWVSIWSTKTRMGEVESPGSSG